MLSRSARRKANAEFHAVEKKNREIALITKDENDRLAEDYAAARATYKRVKRMFNDCQASYSTAAASTDEGDSASESTEASSHHAAGAGGSAPTQASGDDAAAAGIELDDTDKEMMRETATPPGLTKEQANWLPDREETEARIKAMDRETLLALIEANLSKLPSKERKAVHAALDKLGKTVKDVDQAEVRSALDACNAANAHSVSEPLMQPVQQHGAGSDVWSVLCGTFPTSQTMTDSKGTLTSITNMTVMAMALLKGYRPDALADSPTVRINRMPTCYPNYTDCPTSSDYDQFREPHVKSLSDLFAAGIQSFDFISNTNRDDFELALHGDATPRFVTLLTVNGATLELHMPEGKEPVLATFPCEHASHIGWQAAKEATRLFVLEGLVAVHTARAALLDSPPPMVEALLGLVGSTPFLGWYRGGAYAGMVLRTTRRFQFWAAHGLVEGDKLWAAYVHDCAVRGGEWSAKAELVRQGTSAEEVAPHVATVAEAKLTGGADARKAAIVALRKIFKGRKGKKIVSSISTLAGCAWKPTAVLDHAKLTDEKRQSLIATVKAAALEGEKQRAAAVVDVAKAHGYAVAAAISSLAGLQPFQIGNTISKVDLPIDELARGMSPPTNILAEQLSTDIDEEKHNVRSKKPTLQLQLTTKSLLRFVPIPQANGYDCKWQLTGVSLDGKLSSFYCPRTQPKSKAPEGALYVIGKKKLQACFCPKPDTPKKKKQRTA